MEYVEEPAAEKTYSAYSAHFFGKTLRGTDEDAQLIILKF
jgi:hypothetical protein